MSGYLPNAPTMRPLRPAQKKLMVAFSAFIKAMIEAPIDVYPEWQPYLRGPLAQASAILKASKKGRKPKQRT